VKDKSGGMGEPKDPMPPKDKQDLKDKSGGMGEPKDPVPPKDKDAGRKDKQDLKDKSGGMGEPKEPMLPKDKQDVKDKSGGMGEPKDPMPPKDKQDLKDKSGGMGEPKEPMPPKDKQDVKDKSGGTPFDGGKDSAGKNASGKEEPMGTDPNKEFLDRSTELQLEKLRKVDPETLKDLKMTPEEYQEFLKSYEDLLKRRTAEREKLGQPGDKLGGRTGSSIVNKGASKIGGQPTQAGPAQGATITGAPPGFRDAQRQFSDAISRETPPPPRKR
jgi:hypothetical protein